VKLRWTMTGLAATAAILAIGLVLSSREQRGVAAAMPAAAPSDRTTVLRIVRPAVPAAAVRPAAERPQAGASFADRFAGTPLWEGGYGAARTETRTAYASVQAPAAPRRAIDAVETVASRSGSGSYALASASESVTDLTPPSETRTRPTTIASAVAAFSEPNSKIAIYDIAAHTVYMPNGDTLEAHSGLGERQDNPRYVNVKMKGPTPPNVYKMTMRERVFHGVRAIRLTPVDESKMFGRDGMLAHTYMLRNRGHSNGCVVFSNYPAFLAAFQRGEVDRMVVVERLERKPIPASRIASASP
jgi:Protein of unknown function (DUF2778)